MIWEFIEGILIELGILFFDVVLIVFIVFAASIVYEMIRDLRND